MYTFKHHFCTDGRFLIKIVFYLMFISLSSHLLMIIDHCPVDFLLLNLLSAHDVISCHAVAQVSFNICKLCFKFLQKLSES